LNRKLLIAAIAAIAMATPLLADIAEDSDAEAVSEWYAYGHHLEFRDRNYDPSVYQKVEWMYSDEPLDSGSGQTVEGDASDGHSHSVGLDMSAYPMWEVHPLFVREIATMRSGEVRTTEFVVHVNPIPDVCHILFMYDDSHGYMYRDVPRTTSIAVGTDRLVEPPEDPGRDGYRFDGWFSDRELTKPFDPLDPVAFTTESVVKVYPKWTPVSGGSESPSAATRFISLQPVAGLSMEHDGLAVEDGGSFSFEVSVMDGFRFDLSNLEAVTDKGRKVEHSVGADGIHTFRLDDVREDVSVMLTGYVQYFRVTAVLDGVTTVGFAEWVAQGSVLDLPLSPADGGSVSATVYMAGEDVTGSSFSSGRVLIQSVQGDVTIVASSEPSSADGSSSGLWVIVAVVLAAAVALALVLRRRC